MPLILGTNSIKDTGYDVANSCRFNSADSAYMNITSVSTVTSRFIFTISLWVKRSTLGAKSMIGTVGGDGTNFGAIWFDSSDRLNCTEGSGGGELNFITNRVFRDISAWHNIILAIDTTQAVEANRVKIYVNGTQETSFNTATYPSEDSNMHLNRNSKVQYLGRHTDSSNDYYFDGYMAEVVWIDGSQLAATSFGEFDEDSPTIWKPIDVSGLTFGNNGFYCDFEDSGDLGDDESGNTNDWTENNLAATDQSLDSPTNNYPTLNILQPGISNLTVSEGNLNMVAGDANYRSLPATMGATAGKWYAEFKAVSGFSSVDASVGIYRTDNNFVATTGLGNFPGGNSWSYGAAGLVRTDEATDDNEATYTDGDIIQVAMDLDNNKLYFGKNNAYINSGDPTTGATGTGAYAIIAGDFYHFAAATISSGGAKLWSCNFGSPSYANSSDAADANGYGAFEFAPPSGYFAMNSKNLAEYG